MGRSRLWSQALKLEFFTVDEPYIQYLKKTDPKVPNNYSSTKPFIGILFNIHGLDYIAPLTSAKPKHKKIKNKNPAALKIFEHNMSQNLLAIVLLNNMIPVKPSNIKKLNMLSFSVKYKSLLQKEINYIRTHENRLLQKAQHLYSLVTDKQVKSFINISCDFKALEIVSKKYKNN